MFTFSKPRFCTFRCYSSINYCSMPNCGNDFLFNNYYVTYRTVLTFGKTCFRAVGSNSRIDNFGMTCRGNGCLCYEHGITYRAVFTFCLTVGSASSRNRRIDNLSMTKSNNCVLSNEDFFTNRTMCTLGKTRRSTSRSDCSEHGFLMPLGFSSEIAVGYGNGSRNIAEFDLTCRALPILARAVRSTSHGSRFVR